MCRPTHADRGKQPPCNTCFPGVHEYNKETHEIYQYVSDQWLSGPRGAYALDITKVIAIIKESELSQPLVLELARNVCDLALEVLEFVEIKTEQEQKIKKGTSNG